MPSLTSLACASALSLALGALPLAAGAADLEHGKQLVTKSACTSCHGAQFDHPMAPNYPILAGQYPDYLVHALTAYKHGDNAMLGRKNAIMGGMAAALSDEDIKDIAAYISSLPGPLVQEK